VKESAPGNIDWVIKSQELNKKHHVERGSLEGELRKLSGIAGGRRDRLSLFNRVLEEYVPCTFSSRLSELEDLAKQGWKRRVIVSGKIYVSSTSRHPVKIEVDAIQILPLRTELPRLADLPKLDITHGMEESEYVRRLRDAL
jgi:hypothetical protein